MIERSRVRIPAGAAGEFSSPWSIFCADSCLAETATKNHIDTNISDLHLNTNRLSVTGLLAWPGDNAIDVKGSSTGKEINK